MAIKHMLCRRFLNCVLVNFVATWDRDVGIFAPTLVFFTYVPAICLAART